MSISVGHAAKEHIIPSDTTGWVANISILFPELPLLDRAAAAAAAGFAAAEAWWPFPTATPSDADVEAFVASVGASGLPLTALNFYAGDMPGGDRGVASIPARRDELVASLPALEAIAQRTGARHFNLLYGHSVDGVDADEQLAAGVRSLLDAVALVEPWGGTVLVEPLAAGLNGPYPLRTDVDVLAVLDTADTAAGRALPTGLLFDVFHLGSNGVDLVETAHRVAGRVRHVQFADAPGRGEPGSGELPILETLTALREAGYSGRFAAEYKPTRATAETLAWMQDWSEVVP